MNTPTSGVYSANSVNFSPFQRPKNLRHPLTQQIQKALQHKINTMVKRGQRNQYYDYLSLIIMQGPFLPADVQWHLGMSPYHYGIAFPSNNAKNCYGCGIDRRQIQNSSYEYYC